MSVATVAETNKDVIRRYFTSMDRQDFAGVAATLAPDFRSHVCGMPETLDVEAMQGFAQSFFAALADVEHRVEGLVADDTQVAARLTVHGRHVGDLMGVPATGRQVALPALNMYRMDAGLIAEQWVQFDSMGLLAQLGAMPAEAP